MSLVRSNPSYLRKDSEFYKEAYNPYEEPQMVVCCEPNNFIRREGGYMLPYAIKWPFEFTGQFDPDFQLQFRQGRNTPVTLPGVHVHVVVFGFNELLRAFCDELRRATVPEICVVVVGSEEEAEEACDKLEKMRVWQNAGFLVFLVQQAGKWPKGTGFLEQKEEWKTYVGPYQHLPKHRPPPKGRGKICTPGTRCESITFWRGYTSKEIMKSPWGKAMKLRKGFKRGCVKLIDSPDDVMEHVKEETKKYKAWALPGHKEALDERDFILRRDLEAAKKEGEYFDCPVSCDALNSNLNLNVEYSDKPLPPDTTDFWWEEEAGSRMTPEILRIANQRVESWKNRKAEEGHQNSRRGKRKFRKLSQVEVEVNAL